MEGKGGGLQVLGACTNAEPMGWFSLGAVGPELNMVGTGPVGGHGQGLRLGFGLQEQRTPAHPFLSGQ